MNNKWLFSESALYLIYYAKKRNSLYEKSSIKFAGNEEKEKCSRDENFKNAEKYEFIKKLKFGPSICISCIKKSKFKIHKKKIHPFAFYSLFPYLSPICHSITLRVRLMRRFLYDKLISQLRKMMIFFIDFPFFVLQYVSIHVTKLWQSERESGVDLEVL